MRKEVPRETLPRGSPTALARPSLALLSALCSRSLNIRTTCPENTLHASFAGHSSPPQATRVGAAPSDAHSIPRMPPGPQGQEPAWPGCRSSEHLAMGGETQGRSALQDLAPYPTPRLPFDQHRASKDPGNQAADRPESQGHRPHKSRTPVMMRVIRCEYGGRVMKQMWQHSNNW